MLRISVEITDEVEDAQGVKEKLAMDFERYGNVRVVKVERVEPEQMKMEEVIIFWTLRELMF